MIDDPATREHVAAVWGVPADALPGKGRVGVRAARLAGHRPGGPRAMLVFGIEHRGLPRRTRPQASSAAGVASTSWWSRTSCCRETAALRGHRAARDAVGRGDRHHDEPRGPGAPAGAGDPSSGGTCAATWTSSPGWPRGSGRRAVRDRPRRDLRGAGTRVARRARLTTPASTTADPRRARRLSGRARPGPRARRGCSSTGSRRRTGGPGSTWSSTVARRRSCARTSPVHLTTGRVLAQYQSGAQTRRVRALGDEGAFVEAAPDAGGTNRCQRRMDPVRLATRRGSCRHPLECVSTIRPDTVFVPFHWVGANRLTNDALDPSSRMPEFKVCAARSRHDRARTSGRGRQRDGATRLLKGRLVALGGQDRWDVPCSATSRARRTTGSC